MVDQFKVFSQYEKMRSLCTWHTSHDVAHTIDYPSTRAYHMYSTGFLTSSNTNATSVSIKVCVSDALDQNQGRRWHISRIGPFMSSGGNNWRHYASMFPFPNIPANAWITGDASGPVMLDGEFIGQPPLHIHHMHITDHEYIPRPVFTFRFGAHTDQACSSSGGALACLVHEQPDGYGFQMQGLVGSFGLLNDIRPSNSRNLSWSVEIALQCSDRKPGDRVMSVASINAPYFADPRFLGSNSVPGRPKWYGEYADAYLIPDWQYSANWYSATLVQGGNLLWSFLHTHPENLLGLDVYFNVTPNELGLNRNQWMIADERSCFMPIERESKHAIDYLRSSVHELGGQPDCQAGPGVIESVVYGSAVYIGQRYSPVFCRDAQFSDRTRITVVAYNRPSLTPQGVMIPAHGHVRFLLGRQDSAVNQFIFGSHDGKKQSANNVLAASDDYLAN